MFATFFSHKITEKHILIAILALGAILRFWGLGSAEFYHDEGFLAFRSIGYLDYIQNDAQTTPVQWPAVSSPNGSLPLWTHLSFHDHPPLFFLIQYIFFNIFGASLFAARLPSALAGILSVYLVYLISKKYFGWKNRRMVFFAPLLLSVSSIHIWISRSSLQESVQIFFILWNIYWFLKLTDQNSNPSINLPAGRQVQELHMGYSLSGSRRDAAWIWFGVTLGLAFLAKYTSFYLLPVYGFYLFSEYLNSENKKSVLSLSKDYRLYLSLLITLLLFTPVIIYNFYLWKTVGHFDLQFSYLFGQNTPEWQASLGKINDPFSDIISNLVAMYSLPFILLALAGIGLAVYRTYKSSGINRTDRSDKADNSDKTYKPDKSDTTYRTDESYFIFWLLNIIFITLMLTAVGSAFRFLTFYAVPAVMLITILVDRFAGIFNKEILFKIAIAVFFAYELFFGSDILLAFPDFGIVTLDRYFDSEFGNTRSLAMPVSSNPHLDNVIRSHASRIPVGDEPFLIIYDENISLSPRLWLFTRRNYYGGIPAFTVNQFRKFLNERGTEGFSGYDLYFVKASGQTYLNPLYSNLSAQEFEDFLKNELTLTPVKSIYGYDNLLMFSVYKFSL